jgi:hypothetical protein
VKSPDLQERAGRIDTGFMQTILYRNRKIASPLRSTSLTLSTPALLPSSTAISKTEEVRAPTACGNGIEASFGFVTPETNADIQHPTYCFRAYVKPLTTVKRRTR